MLWSAVIDVASGITTSYELYSDPDSLGRPQKVTHLDGTYDYTVYSSCCGLQTVTNREGTVTTSTYDDEKRLSTITRNGITTARNYDAAANVLSTTRNGTDNSAITLSSSGYDSSGRMFATTNAVGDPTSFSTTVYPVVKTTTLPNAATRIESYARDGSLLGTTGTGVHPTRFTNGLVSDGGVTRYFTAEIKLNTDGADTSEMITNFYDLAGRVYKT